MSGVHHIYFHHTAALSKVIRNEDKKIYVLGNVIFLKKEKYKNSKLMYKPAPPDQTVRKLHACKF